MKTLITVSYLALIGVVMLAMLFVASESPGNPVALTAGVLVILIAFVVGSELASRR